MGAEQQMSRTLKLAPVHPGGHEHQSTVQSSTLHLLLLPQTDSRALFHFLNQIRKGFIVDDSIALFLVVAIETFSQPIHGLYMFDQ